MLAKHYHYLLLLQGAIVAQSCDTSTWSVPTVSTGGNFFFVAVKSFDTSIVIVGNFVLNAKTRMHLKF